jgi:serine phosphatase RsbU (regulator of sigma subunit)
MRAASFLPSVSAVLSSLATIGLIVSLSYFVWRLIVLMKRQLLWRVRRKLILSYIFFGVVPALLIVGFFVLGAWTVAMNVSAYLFRDGYDDVVDDVALVSRAAASDIGRGPETVQQVLGRIETNLRSRYPPVSVAFVPAAGRAEPAAQAGRWQHVAVPASLPAWVSQSGFAGAIALAPRNGNSDTTLVARATANARGPKGQVGTVIVDVPFNDEILQRLHVSTGVNAVSVSIVRVGTTPGIGLSQGEAGGGLFSSSVTAVDCRDWTTSEQRRAVIGLRYRVRDVYGKLSSAQAIQVNGQPLGENVLAVMLPFFAILFLIIQIAALVMGLALARSITSSIHELFTGTERVRQGDFGHRITITTKDQLGELADSFNQMTGSIENLLQTAAEKKRLEEELRIARQIQMSLLPRGPLDVPGLGITALCVPAREVGGDYYDFFPLAENRLGVMIADVSGKGTSAALYMAELKGIVLALSQRYHSPREMLCEANRILAENLDSRSFITVTYAVIDLDAGRMTYCRAGHTPLIYLPGPSAPTRGAQVLTPSGMVLGLRLPGAFERFDELLEEETVALHGGDVIVLYTDGITEAMNANNDLFGETRLSKIVEEHGHLGSGELRERILREIESFVGGADQHDDMTMILLKVDPSITGRGVEAEAEAWATL